MPQEERKNPMQRTNPKEKNLRLFLEPFSQKRVVIKLKLMSVYFYGLSIYVRG